MRKIKNLLSNFLQFFMQMYRKVKPRKTLSYQTKKKKLQMHSINFFFLFILFRFFLLSTFRSGHKKEMNKVFFISSEILMIFFQVCELLVQFRIENCIQVQCTLCCCFYSASIRAIEWNFYAESIASFSTRPKPNQLTHHHLISDSTTCYFALATSNMHQSF